ncbi:hypothetical protein Mtc_1052 [Methanocella conradii HZ254]|uniref:Uncharacterized protein n=1 Tax=Methanocella conradii (strain DSM 24694 / JCM 17849 / CGMCC 1.5162 / HZ254) TaxID=1041930 RepID=H8I6X8_METCZ|nr:hypothetical protein [Methanocella conradii]AFC99808.1 hypothetical protein Mtc_1052 [Methanocella conradii HZ254]MDI6896476.1 hypothetical protein [Methanocella conradii]
MDIRDIRFIEIGGSILILLVFIGLFALVGFMPQLKPWSNILYVVLFLAYTAAMCLFGLKLAPYLSE